MELLRLGADMLGVWAYVLVPLLSILLYGAYNAWLHPLRHYPGPLLWRAFLFPYVVSTHKGQLHKQLKEFHTIYGPIVRIAPNELSYADSTAWKDIYTTTDPPFPRNNTWFRKQSPDEPHSIMGFNEEAHARFKRAFVNAFSDKSLRDQAPVVENYVDQLISKLQKSKAKALDLEHLMECISFDIGSDLSFGESFDSLKTGKVHPWVEVAKGFGKGLALIASINQYPPLERLLRFIIPKKVLQKMQGHAQMSSAMAQKRLATHTSRPDFVTPTKAHVDAKGGISGKEWDINLMILVFAASETVASALTAIFRHLVQHPGVLHRLTSELRTTFACEADVTIASTAQLPYLNAVVNESLRIAPPVVIGVPRVVPAGGATICGRYVPAGTYVAYNQHAANRQSYNFRAPNSFIPERFLSPARGPSLYTKDNMAGFKPFGVGRHQCIGMKLAWAEMRVVVARVLWQFDIKLAEERDVWDWGEQATYIFWEKRALEVLVREREEERVRRG